MSATWPPTQYFNRQPPLHRPPSLPPPVQLGGNRLTGTLPEEWATSQVSPRAAKRLASAPALDAHTSTCDRLPAARALREKGEDRHSTSTAAHAVQPTAPGRVHVAQARQRVHTLLTVDWHSHSHPPSKTWRLHTLSAFYAGLCNKPAQQLLHGACLPAGLAGTQRSAPPPCARLVRQPHTHRHPPCQLALDPYRNLVSCWPKPTLVPPCPAPKQTLGKATSCMLTPCMGVRGCLQGPGRHGHERERARGVVRLTRWGSPHPPVSDSWLVVGSGC